MADRAQTRAELEDEVDRLMKANHDLRGERDAWRNVRLADGEAEAISGCVKAIDAMRSADTQRSGNASFYAYSGGTSPVERILKFLAARYGVTWYDPPAPEPAPIDPQAVAEAVAEFYRRNGRMF